MSTQAASARQNRQVRESNSNNRMQSARVQDRTSMRDVQPMQETQHMHPMQETQHMHVVSDGRNNPMPSPGSETAPAFRTTEFWIYLAAVGAVLLASDLVRTDASGVDPFRANTAWLYITLLTLAYLVSRGLAKAGNAWRPGKERSGKR